jgi:hypothetical protein
MFRDNLQNILGANSADNQFASDLVIGNPDGSIIERLEAIKNGVPHTSYNSWNYLASPITFAAGTTGSVASHEIFTVTGMVRVRIIPECTVDVAGTGTIELGVAGDTDIMLGTTTGTDIDGGKLWLDTSPAEFAWNFSSVIDKVIPNGLDIGYEVKTNTLTGGAITFHCWWEPLNSTGAVIVADGTTAL